MFLSSIKNSFRASPVAQNRLYSNTIKAHTKINDVLQENFSSDKTCVGHSEANLKQRDIDSTTDNRNLVTFFDKPQTIHTNSRTQITKTPSSSQELRGLSSAQVKLEKILIYLNSAAVIKACQQSPALEICRTRLKTSLFHLNFQPEVIEKNKPNYAFMDASYPYEPVYHDRFPARPTFEVMHDAVQFARLMLHLENENIESQQLIEDLYNYLPYKSFSQHLQQPPKAQETPRVIETDTIVNNPVEAYFTFRQRLEQHGEVASFPEFAHAVSGCLAELQSSEIQDLAREDSVFKAEVENAIKQLNEVTKDSGPAIPVQAAFSAPYPYRRVLAALEKAVEVFDMRERLKYPESKNWFEVEESWFPVEGEKAPKLLPLYHFNRYKYQQFGLMANPEVVLFPWFGDAEIEDLIRLRSVPIGLVGVITATLRADRHHNTPLDFWYHDINHIRRMWGYDKKLMEQMHLHTLAALKAHMQERQMFIEDLLRNTDPTAPGLNEEEKQVKRLERDILFETFHETALSATREALLNDLTRNSTVPQPFEVQIQSDEYQKELNRQFDGNLKSGADVLEEGFFKPTKIQYFFDRAPGFLSNVYNKIAFGFHTSVFEERHIPDNLKYRTPEYLAQAALNIFNKVGYPEGKIPSANVLIANINDRAGQPELYNYFALRPEDDITKHVRHHASKPNNFNLARAEIRKAKAIKLENSSLTSLEIASQVQLTSLEHREMLHWMQAQLKEYARNFDELFAAKLSRSHQHAFVNADDYIKQFVGHEKGKLIATAPSEFEREALDQGGTLYVDTWAVPYFNSATQTKAQARAAVEQALKTFQNAKFDQGFSLLQFTELAALYARPEFDDLRRYKLKIFPSEADLERFGQERNDGKLIGDLFPKEAFIMTNQELSLDELSFTFGQNIHFMGLVSHSDVMRADNRVFVGAADFYEHDFAHGYFSLELPVPGSANDWNRVHEEFRLIQAKIPDRKERLMNSLVYFHFTHESGYKGMLPDAQGNQPKFDAYKDELEVIKTRIETPNDYEWIKKPENIGENYAERLAKSFSKIGSFFDQHLNAIYNASSNKSIDGQGSNRIEE